MSENEKVLDDKKNLRSSSNKLQRCTYNNLEVHNQSQQETEMLINSEVVDKVVTNYVIAKEILSNLSWQDKQLCRNVCSTWYSAVKTLRREQLSPVDFFVDFKSKGDNTGLQIQRSCQFCTEPLIIFTFMNILGFSKSTKCKDIVPWPCSTPCEYEHIAIDAVHRSTCIPKDCMFGVKSSYISYMPLPKSITKDYTLTRLEEHAVVAGLYVPVIPDVQSHIIKLKSNLTMKHEFYSAIDTILTDQIIKGIIVFVTDKHLLNTVEDIVFLNYVKEVQPDIPYALGGCICEDTVCDSDEIEHLVSSMSPANAVSDCLISIGILTLPKTQKNECNFDMFSLIIESSDWEKQKIQATISQFAKSVPQYEHSVALKLSCIGRDRKHRMEQDLFRESFPNTRIIGCYGNGELGENHPEKPIPEWPNNKKSRRFSGPQFGVIYSYSTVFVYMGWGKVLSAKD